MSSKISRQHPLLLWLDAAGWEGSVSLVAYYLLLFVCGWYVLRRGRAWARARLSLVGDGKSGGGDGAVVGDKAPKLTYVDSERNRRLLARTPLLGRPYVPSPWLGHRVSALALQIAREFGTEVLHTCGASCRGVLSARLSGMCLRFSAVNTRV